MVDTVADIDAPPFDIRGRTALQAAVLSRNTEILRFLCDHGADINGPIALTGGITTLEAVFRCKESMEDYDEDWNDNDYRAATEAFIFLLDKGASVNHSDGSMDEYNCSCDLQGKGTKLLLSYQVAQ